MGRVLQIPTARAYLPLLQPNRYKGAYGGRGSAKSHFFGDEAIDRCVQASTRIVCVREYQTTLEQSVKRLLTDKIRAHNLEGDRPDQFRIMNNQIMTPNEGVIIFQGMQTHNAESIKSLEGFDVAWVEEAQSLSQRSLDLLRPTLRKPGSELWFSWNPDQPTDPVDKLLRGAVLPPRCCVVGTTFRDNPWFPPELQEEMEFDRTADYEKYEHIWEGKYESHSEARVFKNWKIEEFETPDNTLFYFGGDWGFSIDPSVLMRMWIKPKQPGTPGRDTLYIDNEVYKIGCEIDHLPQLFDSLVCRCGWLSDSKWVPFAPCNHPQHAMARAWKATVDNARPETISYMNRHGYPRMEAAIKGKDSVKEGVIFLQGFNIIIHPRCRHTIDEFKNYSYVKDAKTGEISPILEDKKNHVIDSARYGVEPIRKPRRSATF
jgi:phage terminase large subunit